jgi:hypothetical protein
MLSALGAERGAAVEAARPMTQPPNHGAEEFERAQFVLEDARERARRIIDQSVIEAQDLLTRSSSADDLGVRRSLSALTDEMYDLRLRLERIEALLRRQEQNTVRGYSPAPPPPAYAPAQTPAPPVQPYTAPVAAAPPPAPTLVPTALPELAADRLMPEDGPVIVLVSPVAGFQGLMRVQDALVQTDAVAEAIVEGYAQGEARLRLQLRAPVTAATIGDELSAALAQPADVQASAGDERTLRVTLA